jgi:hypothetical protein
LHKAGQLGIALFHWEIRDSDGSQKGRTRDFCPFRVISTQGENFGLPIADCGF